MNSLSDLREALEKQDVVLDQDRRRSRIKTSVKELAALADLRVFDDPELLDEVNFLVESPYPIMGEFSEDFLELPASILITCMKKHQRYFSIQDKEGRITNRFIAVNNTPVKDPSVSVRGHQRVLKARLEDARFYYREDRRIPTVRPARSAQRGGFSFQVGNGLRKGRTIR